MGKFYLKTKHGDLYELDAHTTDRAIALVECKLIHMIEWGQPIVIWWQSSKDRHPIRYAIREYCPVFDMYLYWKCPDGGWLDVPRYFLGR